MTADTASRPIPDGIPCPPRLALVGDRSLDVQAHGRIPSIVDFVNSSSGDPIEVYWLHSTSLSQPADVTGFDGVWVVPGSPYENMAGVLSAIEGARSSGIPLLGTCGGFQHLLLEFAHNVCGLEGVAHGEVAPAADQQLITPLDCSLLGEEATVVVVPGTKAAEAMGAARSRSAFSAASGSISTTSRCWWQTAWSSVDETSAATPASRSCPGIPSSSVRCSNQNCLPGLDGLTRLSSPLRRP